MKHFVERKMGKQIEVDSVLFSWLIGSVTETMNKFEFGFDGNTAYRKDSILYTQNPL